RTVVFRNQISRGRSVASAEFRSTDQVNPPHGRLSFIFVLENHENTTVKLFRQESYRTPYRCFSSPCTSWACGAARPSSASSGGPTTAEPNTSRAGIVAGVSAPSCAAARASSGSSSAPFLLIPSPVDVPQILTLTLSG